MREKPVQSLEEPVNFSQKATDKISHWLSERALKPKVLGSRPNMEALLFQIKVVKPRWSEDLKYPLQSSETVSFQDNNYKNSCCTSTGVSIPLILVALDFKISSGFSQAQAVDHR